MFSVIDKETLAKLVNETDPDEWSEIFDDIDTEADPEVVKSGVMRTEAYNQFEMSFSPVMGGLTMTPKRDIVSDLGPNAGGSLTLRPARAQRARAAACDYNSVP